MLFALNRSYAGIYNNIGQANLVNPNLQNNYILGNSKAILKYAALGDSLTAGVGADSYQKTYPYILAEHLLNQAPVSLTILAHPGSTSQSVLDSQVQPAINLKPNLVTILIGTNDIHNFVSTQDYEKNYIEIVEKLKSTGANIILINIPYTGSPDSVKFPYNFYFNAKTKQFNQIIQTISQKEQVKLIDIYTPTYQLMSSSNDYYSPDLFHPSSKGYILWGQIINGYSYF